jgi:hypothetical protein
LQVYRGLILKLDEKSKLVKGLLSDEVEIVAKDEQTLSRSQEALKMMIKVAKKSLAEGFSEFTFENQTISILNFVNEVLKTSWAKKVIDKNLEVAKDVVKLLLGCLDPKIAEKQQEAFNQYIKKKDNQKNIRDFIFALLHEALFPFVNFSTNRALPLSLISIFREIHETEKNYKTQLAKLVSKEWELGSKEKGTIFDALLHAKVITPTEKKLLSADWEEAMNSSESLLKAIELFQNPLESPLSQTVEIFITQFSPLQIREHLRGIRFLAEPKRYQMKHVLIKRVEEHDLAKKFAEQNQNLSLEDVLIVPVQRAPRYEGFIKQVEELLIEEQARLQHMRAYLHRFMS